MKSRYRKLATGGAVLAEAPPIPDAPLVTAAPIPDPVIEPDELDQAELPASAKAWLRKPENEQYLYDEGASAKLADMHWKVVDTGLEPYSEPYFAEIERRLNKPPVSADVDPEAVEKVLAQARRSAPKPKAEDDAPRIRYSAPPSREPRSSNGSRYYSDDPRGITLTPAQKEAARFSNISESEYARQLIRLRQEKEIGNHGGQP